ncbi:uncharacterized protein BDR25DRAFT_360079 [Lindgomyces ingoldianus]|uniref:Uncharacterized protein n=1 Tax=Lindgomyces ingoldianus TaxID=673940 RepID=A0ACB6QGA9_9PLEO|nr:uncharacterized protein BDR25DRAFT_360079 [Lindgomyces ingoldianus]KAF2465915.1 hypothetical protein BDR25DRAFT_360079 [Lindgomyces ingoldianus]
MIGIRSSICRPTDPSSGGPEGTSGNRAASEGPEKTKESDILSSVTFSWFHFELLSLQDDEAENFPHSHGGTVPIQKVLIRHRFVNAEDFPQHEAFMKDRIVSRLLTARELRVPITFDLCLLNCVKSEKISNGVRSHFNCSVVACLPDHVHHCLHRTRLASMLPNEHVERDTYHDNTVAGAQADDEEAQLLPTEELEFEDNLATSLPYTARHRSIWHWLQGAQPPRPQTIHPFLPSIQRAPIRFLDRILPGKHHQSIVLAACLLLWAIVFLLFLRSQLPIKDGAGRNIVNLDCVDTLWKPKNQCGVDGIDCRPFSNDSFAFRCPAKCAGVQLLNPRAVGPLHVNYRPLVVGDEIYRGDSFICGSAIHSGIISDTKGGCGRVSRLGNHDEFPSAKRHGIESIPFDSYFPLSFSVLKDPTIQCRGDPRQALLVVSLLFTTLFSIFSTSPLQFFPTFTLIFAHVSFASDPPSASYLNISVLPDHISMFAKRFLPAFFCAVVLYWTVVKRTLSGLEAQFEKTVFWLGGFWFGALSNYTFDWIPISRLTAHDLEQQPGAKVALAVILIILVCIIAQQIYYFWLERRLLRYLALYGLFILVILICLVIPGVLLRIHHYILALLLLPGTSVQTRPSLLYQGILLGLFVNGIARWDFDSILQTADVLRGDGSFDSVLPSLMQPLIFQDGESFTASFSWEIPPVGVHGISVLVNDVERDRAFFTDEGVHSFVWTRSNGLDLPEYFRLGYIKEGRALDYTKVGTLFANGTWGIEEVENGEQFLEMISDCTGA